MHVIEDTKHIMGRVMTTTETIPMRTAVDYTYLESMITTLENGKISRIFKTHPEKCLLINSH
jgi:hypothetical protein